MSDSTKLQPTHLQRGAIVYVLKGAHVDKRNNYNPLVTVHFNTPVTSAPSTQK